MDLDKAEWNITVGKFIVHLPESHIEPERLDIPYKVVINEALELAKAFASPDSYTFVNGVLDKVTKIVRNT